jgi:integrase/recombinase XerD
LPGRQRRATAMGLKLHITCHTFRATGITAYMDAGGTLENAQLIVVCLILWRISAR